jgi:hypothetical protein
VTKWHRWLIALARELGMSNVHIEPGGRHPRLVATYKGQTVRNPISVREGVRHMRITMRQQLKRAMLRCVEQLNSNDGE